MVPRTGVLDVSAQHVEVVTVVQAIRAAHRFLALRLAAAARFCFGRSAIASFGGGGVRKSADTASSNLTGSRSAALAAFAIV